MLSSTWICPFYNYGTNPSTSTIQIKSWFCPNWLFLLYFCCSLYPYFICIAIFLTENWEESKANILVCDECCGFYHGWPFTHFKSAWIYMADGSGTIDWRINDVNDTSTYFDWIDRHRGKILSIIQRIRYYHKHVLRNFQLLSMLWELGCSTLWHDCKRYTRISTNYGYPSGRRHCFCNCIFPFSWRLGIF